MTYSQQAYDAIKRKIVTLKLPPGSVIDETSLRNELGLGRTPIREALKRLERDRLVTIVPRRGTFVTDIELDDLVPLYESRAVLEAFIAQAAAQRGQPHHWQQMEAVLEEAHPADGSPEMEDLLEVDRRCHEIMYAAANHVYLTDTLVMLYAQSQRLWHKFLPRSRDLQSAIATHWAILNALKAGNGVEAARLASSHIHDFQAAIQAGIMKTVTSG